MYKNEITEEVISDSKYASLDEIDQEDYYYVSGSNSSSFLNSAIIGGVTDSAILGGLLGGDITGGILGDMIDGDLFD